MNGITTTPGTLWHHGTHQQSGKTAMIEITIQALGYGFAIILIAYGSCWLAALGEPRIEPRLIDYLKEYGND